MAMTAAPFPSMTACPPLTPVCRYLDLGSYLDWSEDRRLEWLSQELEGRRPLIPVAMPMPQEVREVCCI